MQICIIYELTPERAVEMPGAASDEARLNLTGNAKAEEWCGRWRPAAVRNARRLTLSCPLNTILIDTLLGLELHPDNTTC